MPAAAENGSAAVTLQSSAALEVLHRTLVLFGRRARLERAEISAAAGPRIAFSRIEAVLTRRKLPNHLSNLNRACDS